MPSVQRVRSTRRSDLLALVALGLAFLVHACSAVFPGPVTGDVKILVLSYDATSQKYKMVRGTLKTLKNLRTMEGDAAKILGGAEVRIDYEELARVNPQTREELEAVIYKSPGKPVDASFFEVDGILHAEDFHSLNLATTYYNFEKAHLFFAGLNAALYELPVQYFPSVERIAGGKVLVETDNASWDPVIRTFTVLPFKELDELPMGMNAGIIGHEFTHAVFSNRVFPKDDSIDWLFQRYFKEPEIWSPVVNLSRSFDEGLADFFGAVISGDPAFIRKSLKAIEAVRRLDPPSPRCLTTALRQAQLTTPFESYDPYPLGSVLAAALWESVAQTPDRVTPFAKSVTEGMTELGNAFVAQENKTTLAQAVEAIASTLIADLKPRACGILLDRFKLEAVDVPSCTGATTPDRKCPN